MFNMQVSLKKVGAKKLYIIKSYATNAKCYAFPLMQVCFVIDTATLKFWDIS